MIAQISAVKIDAESGNLMDNSVSDGKTVAHATELPYLFKMLNGLICDTCIYCTAVFLIYFYI